MKILYVENHILFARTVVENFLSQYEVNIVPTIVLAKKILEEKHFAIALIDYDLDDGKGDELIQWIKINYPDLKIIAVSSHSDGNKKLKMSGADAICPKSSFKKIDQEINNIISN